MTFDLLLVYVTVSFFYVISPGPAIFLAITNGMSQTPKAVLASTLGNILGLFLLSTISMLGLGSIIVASASLFLLTKVIGAAYLIYLGVKQLKTSLVFSKTSIETPDSTVKPLRSYFKEGFYLASSNPKAILFFLAIFPQFLNIKAPLTSQFFILTFIFMTLSYLSLMSYGLMGKTTKILFKSKVAMAWFHRVTGGLFIVMGLALMKLKSVNS